MNVIPCQMKAEKEFCVLKHLMPPWLIPDEHSSKRYKITSFGHEARFCPLFCCALMTEPFRRFSMETAFYAVNYHDALTMELDIAPCKDRRFMVQIIWFSYADALFLAQSANLVASIRKRKPVLCGGYCTSVYGKLTVSAGITQVVLFAGKHWP